MRQEDIAEIISLRINARTRLYGIRDERAFKMLWYDPRHDRAKTAVCPARAR